MAKTQFDIKGIRTEAAKGLHAGVGAADLAIEAVREYVVEYVTEAQKRIGTVQKDAQKALTSAQKSVKDFEFEPKALRSQATTVVNARVEELSKEAKARREAIEKRVAELQSDAQKFWTSNVETATGTYEELAKRGEKVVKRVRKETSSVVDPGPVAKSTGETKTTAKKAPTKKTTARTSTAKKAPAKKAPARKASAAKKTPSKATASS